jgi:DNA-binding LacI/PurR family transcriptional regulator
MTPNAPPSCRDIARLAGVSANTVSLALRKSPRISNTTRERIERVAAQLGYTPDPRLGEYLRYIRQRRRTKHLPVLALVNAHPQPVERLPSPNIRAIAAAAIREAARQGYRLEEFWLQAPDMTPPRLSAIIEARGIRGVVILPLPAGSPRLDLNWSAFAAVTTCYSAYRMGLNVVTTNRQHYLELALQEMRALGYRRVGLAIDEDTDDRSHHQTLAHFLWDQSQQKRSERVAPLFAPVIDRPALARWLKEEHPDGIISTRNHLFGLLRELGRSVPRDIGFASLAASARDVPSLAGVDERPGVVGTSTIDLLVAQLQREEYGLPSSRRLLLVEGSWISGKTVRAVKRTPNAAKR